MILLPTHACLTDAPGAVAYGELDAANVATCIVRVQWETGARLRGCGARLAVCFGCGLRTRAGEMPPPCEACGATQRPEVVHGDRQAVREAAAMGAEASGDAGAVAADATLVSPVASRAAERQRQIDAGPRRPSEAKAPSKPRAPRKIVKKGPAPSDEPTLPGVK